MKNLHRALLTVAASALVAATPALAQQKRLSIATGGTGGV